MNDWICTENSVCPFCWGVKLVLICLTNPPNTSCSVCSIVVHKEREREREAINCFTTHQHRTVCFTQSAESRLLISRLILISVQMNGRTNSFWCFIFWRPCCRADLICWWNANETENRMRSSDSARCRNKNKIRGDLFSEFNHRSVMSATVVGTLRGRSNLGMSHRNTGGATGI